MTIIGTPISGANSKKKTPQEKFVTVGMKTNGFNVSRGLVVHMKLVHNDVVGFSKDSESNWYIFKANTADINKSYCFMFKQYKQALPRINCRPVASQLLSLCPLPDGRKTQRFYISKDSYRVEVNGTTYEECFKIILVPFDPKQQ